MKSDDHKLQIYFHYLMQEVIFVNWLDFEFYLLVFSRNNKMEINHLDQLIKIYRIIHVAILI